VHILVAVRLDAGVRSGSVPVRALGVHRDARPAYGRLLRDVGRPAMLRHPATGKPCHKVCAERAAGGGAA
jgi:hypothetical protein